jgi:hypothetical protein
MFCVAALAPLAALAQDRQCESRVQSEIARLEREYAKQKPDAADTAGQQRWQRQLQGALQSVALEAERCRQRAVQAEEAARHAQQALNPADPQGDTRALQSLRAVQPVQPSSVSASSCLDHARVLGEELARRYGGRELSPTEQLRLKSEEEKLVTQRQACIQQP